MGRYPERRREENERARLGLRLIATDMRRITEACGVALATGRALTMRLYHDDLTSPVLVSQKLRALIRFEERYPHPGARAVLRRALRDQERRQTGAA